MTEPPPPPAESPRRLTGEALTFLGPLLAFGGLVAMLRTAELNLFYAALIPAGLAMAAAGIWMRKRNSKGS